MSAAAMVWRLFLYVLIFPGFVVLLLLASGNAAAMKLASIILSAPISLGNFRFSVAVVMTALAGIASVASKSGLDRSETSKLNAQDPTLGFRRDPYQLERDVFHHGRNYYMCLLGLMLWATSWRLKVLYDSGTLAPPRVAARWRSPGMRILTLLGGFVALLLSDVPLCRVNYNLQLFTFVTPHKERLLASGAACADVFESMATGPCATFCTEVRQLSQERSNTIMFARKWHILGAYAAELFDDMRGVEQGTSRVDELFQKKTCYQVLKSVDKSNQYVNVFCLSSAAVAIIVSFFFFSKFVEPLPGVAANDKRD